MPRMKSWGLDAPLYLNYRFGDDGSDLPVDTAIFVADDDYELVEARESHVTAGSDGGAVTLDVVKAASGTAVGSGTSMLASTFSLKSTAATPVAKSDALGTTSRTEANRQITKGDTVYADHTGTATAVAGGCLTLVFKRTRKTLDR
jgi:hypothetical protein